MAVAVGDPGQEAQGDDKQGTQSEDALLARAIKAAQGGEMEAIAFLYARYADRVLRYLRSIIGDEHEAEDLTQQVFIKLVGVIGKYELREVPFASWLMCVARNLAFDHLRYHRCIPCTEIRKADGSGEQPEADTPEVVLRAQGLQEALAALPPEHRQILILRHLVGLSPSEIALRTGRTDDSIHGLHHRGRRSLKADLRGRGLAPAVLTAGA